MLLMVTIEVRDKLTRNDLLERMREIDGVKFIEEL